MLALTAYKAHGLVLGLDWGFNGTAYPAEDLFSYDLEDLKEKIEAGVKDGSLDSGMGYQKLYGALMIIETTRTIRVEGRDYHNTTTKRYYSKELTPKQKYFLLQCIRR